MRHLACIVVCCISAAWTHAPAWAHAAASTHAAEFHVSPVGSDDNPATAAAPVRSLEKARDLA
ncbi:MAG: hypothetical protein ACYC6Y_31065, partial [Thermoguttaceae bacterium]